MIEPEKPEITASVLESREETKRLLIVHVSKVSVTLLWVFLLAFSVWVIATALTVPWWGALLSSALGPTGVGLWGAKKFWNYRTRTVAQIREYQEIIRGQEQRLIAQQQALDARPIIAAIDASNNTNDSR